MSEETVTFNLELDVSEGYSQIRKFELLLYRTIALINRLGLPENTKRAIVDLQRMIMTIRILHRSIILLQAALVPGAGWLTGALAVVGMVGAFATASDFAMSIGE